MGLCSMKIAIITIMGGQNYGNRLQNYALHRTLLTLGFDVETIKRKTWRDKNRYINTLKRIFNTIRGKKIGYAAIFRKKRFDQFNKKHIVLSKYTLSNNKAPLCIQKYYAYFVIGSDQVWNAGFKTVSDDILNYLAIFAKPEQRVAYAASFGTDKITPGYEQFFYDELPKFKAISVREESGINLVEQCGAKAVVVLDPTMLLSSVQWHEISEKPLYISSDRFIVTYFLGGRDQALIEYINKIADGRKIYNLEIEDVPEIEIESFDVYSTSPDEFLWLIENADCILTDSFHATVFSILFHKPFCVFERKAINESYKMGNRIETLLGLFHLERFHDRNRSFSIIPKEYETHEIERILKIEREKSIEFLRNALS